MTITDDPKKEQVSEPEAIVEATDVAEVDIDDLPPPMAPPAKYDPEAGITVVPVDKVQSMEVVKTADETGDEKEGLTGPKGGFSTALCGCCDLCCVKCLWWMSCCCDFVVLGQMMQRLGLTWLAQKAATPEGSKNTCSILVIIGVAYYVLATIMSIAGVPNFTAPIFGLYFLIVGCCLRNHFRKLYEIPPMLCTCCEGWLDDFCCMWWCGCCSLVQMVRHTHDEERFVYEAGSPTGLPSYAPKIA